MLEDRPEIQRAFLTDTESDRDNVIVTIAIRGVASFEMLIPMQKYDPFAVLDIIKKYGEINESHNRKESFRNGS